VTVYCHIMYNKLSLLEELENCFAYSLTCFTKLLRKKKQSNIFFLKFVMEFKISFFIVSKSDILCYPLSANWLKLFLFFFSCRGLNLTSVVLSMSVVLVVVIQWLISTKYEAIMQIMLFPTLIPSAWVVHERFSICQNPQTFTEKISKQVLWRNFFQPTEKKCCSVAKVNLCQL